MVDGKPIEWIRSNEWTQIGAKLTGPTARFGASIVHFSGSLYIFGGYDDFRWDKTDIC